jgi:hypothetical protein
MGLGGRPRTQANETTFETSRTHGPLPAAGPHPGLARCRHSYPPSGPRGLTAPPGAEPAVTLAGWLIRPPGAPSSRSHDITGGGARPTRTQRPADSARPVVASVTAVSACRFSGSAWSGTQRSMTFIRRQRRMYCCAAESARLRGSRRRLRRRGPASAPGSALEARPAHAIGIRGCLLAKKRPMRREVIGTRILVAESKSL